MLLYYNTLNASFHLDDRTSIIENEAIHNINNVKAIWNFSPTRFVAYVSFAGNYHFNKLHVTGYHVVNIIIHLVTSMFVWWFTLLTFSTPLFNKSPVARHDKIIAVATGLLFAVHPIQTQAVTYIVQRLASLSTLFYISSLCLYINGRLCHYRGSSHMLSWAFFSGSLITAALGMFTKETVFTLPLIIASYELYFFKTKSIFKLKFIIPVIILLFIIPLTMYTTKVIDFNQLRAVHEGTEGIVLLSPVTYFCTQLRVLITYLRLLLFPINQNLDYHYPIAKSFFEFTTLASFSVLTAIALSGFLLYRRHTVLSFCIFWFFITLIPESSIIPIRDVIFEHRLYLPMVGYSLFIVALLYNLFYIKYPRAIITLILIIAICFSSLTYARNRVWSTELTLWNDTINKSPNKDRPYINRGFTYAHMKEYEKAIIDFDHALAINHNSAMAYYNRGLAYYYKGVFEKSLSDFTSAINLYPLYWQAYYNRGLTYLNTGRFDLSIADFTQAITIKPTNYDSYYNRGIVHGKKGEYDKALYDFEQALSIKPNNEELHYNKGLIYYYKKDYDKSITEYTTALQLNSHYAKAYNNRAIVFFMKKDYEKAWSDVTIMQDLGYQVDLSFLQKLRIASGRNK